MRIMQYLLLTGLFWVAMISIPNGDGILQPLEIIKAVITMGVYIGTFVADKLWGTGK